MPTRVKGAIDAWTVAAALTAVISATCAEGHVIPFFARYKLPNKPNHIFKEGILRIRVGKLRPGLGTEPRPYGRGGPQYYKITRSEN
jgi:hypothetical protein